MAEASKCMYAQCHPSSDGNDSVIDLDSDTTDRGISKTNISVTSKTVDTTDSYICIDKISD